MNKFLPGTLALSSVALIAIAFIFPIVQNNQLAAVASTNTAGFTFKTKSLRVEEGNALKVTVVAPPNLTKTTRVPVQIQTGTASGSDIQTTTKYVTFYRGGLSEKTITVQTKTDNVTEQPENFSLKIDGSSETAAVTLYEKGTVNTSGNRIVGNTNTNTDPYTTSTTTAISTPPTNCAQYAGVLPGETRKLNVVYAPLPKIVYNYPISSEAQQQLDSMQDSNGVDIGRGGDLRFSERMVTRLAILPGQVYSFKIKTTEYNYPLWHQLAYGSNPLTPGGIVATSVSKCPGDFTSPQVMAQTTGHDEYNTGNSVGDQKFRNCVGYGSPANDGGGVIFGIGGNTQYICALEPNSTYYINITAGFAGGGDKGPTTPHIGTFDGTTPGTSLNPDVAITPYGHLQAAGGSGNNTVNLEYIKNKSAYYAEAKRIYGLVMAQAQARTAACSTAITAGGQKDRGALGGGGECSNLKSPMAAYRYETK